MNDHLTITLDGQNPAVLDDPESDVIRARVKIRWCGRPTNCRYEEA